MHCKGIGDVRRMNKDDNTSASQDKVSITFSTDDTSRSFSIRCGKCADIHNAQLDGKTNKQCDCDCHSTYSQPYVPYYPPYNPCIPDPCCPQLPPTYYTTTITSGVNGTIDPTAGGTTWL